MKTTAKSSKIVNKSKEVNIIGIKFKNNPANVTFVSKDGKRVPQESVRTRQTDNGTRFIAVSK